DRGTAPATPGRKPGSGRSSRKQVQRNSEQTVDAQQRLSNQRNLIDVRKDELVGPAEDVDLRVRVERLVGQRSQPVDLRDALEVIGIGGLQWVNHVQQQYKQR